MEEIMQKVNEAISKVHLELDTLRDELVSEVEFNLAEAKKQLDEAVKVRKANAKKAKTLKEKEKGMAGELTRIEEAEARIRKDEELTKYQDKLDEDLARLAKREKFVSDKDQEVRAKLEEVEARELKLLEKERTYKKKIEKDILDRFLTK